MITQYQQVKQFMQLFKQSCPQSPIIPDLEVRKLRARLILEEALETIDALGIHFTILAKGYPAVTWSCDVLTFEFHRGDEPNLVKVLDGICDLEYVNKGLAISCGIPENKLNAAFNEVHRSNMSKMWSEEQLEAGKKKYPTCIVEHYGGGLYRLLMDGKVIKSPTYSPANLEQFLVEDKPLIIDGIELTPYCNHCNKQPCKCGYWKDEP